MVIYLAARGMPSRFYGRLFAKEWRAVQDIRKGAASEIKSLLVKGRHALLEELISGQASRSRGPRPGSHLGDRHLQLKPHAGGRREAPWVGAQAQPCAVHSRKPP